MCNIMRLRYYVGKTPTLAVVEDTWLTEVYREYGFRHITAGMLKSIMEFLEEDALQLPRVSIS